MNMKYEELDQTTRQYMLREFEAEETSGKPYRSKALSADGLRAFPGLMRQAIQSGNEQTLYQALNVPEYWEPDEPYVRGGAQRTRRRNIEQSARRLALSEFGTWYVRGMARRLLDEGEEECQVYLAETPDTDGKPGECSLHEGMVLPVREVYKGHRRRYWPEPGNRAALSVPSSPGCHHLIRRVDRPTSGIAAAL